MHHDPSDQWRTSVCETTEGASTFVSTTMVHMSANARKDSNSWRTKNGAKTLMNVPYTMVVAICCARTVMDLTNVVAEKDSNLDLTRRPVQI